MVAHQIGNKSRQGRRQGQAAKQPDPLLGRRPLTNRQQAEVPSPAQYEDRHARQPLTKPLLSVNAGAMDLVLDVCRSVYDTDAGGALNGTE